MVRTSPVTRHIPMIGHVPIPSGTGRDYRGGRDEIHYMIIFARMAEYHNARDSGHLETKYISYFSKLLVLTSPDAVSIGVLISPL